MIMAQPKSLEKALWLAQGPYTQLNFCDELWDRFKGASRGGGQAALKQISWNLTIISQSLLKLGARLAATQRSKKGSGKGSGEGFSEGF